MALASSRLGGRLNGFLLGSVTGIAIVTLASVAYFIVAEKQSAPSSPLVGTTDAVWGHTQSPVHKINSSTELQELLADRSFYNRKLTMLELLADARPNRIREIFHYSESLRPVSLRNEIQSIVIRKLTLTDPVDALKQIANLEANHRYFLTEAMYREWSALSLEDAIKHAKSMDASSRRAALRGVLHGRKDLSDEILLEIARELENEQLALDRFAQSQLLLEIDDPETSLDSFLSRHGSQVTELSETEKLLLVHIVRSWIDADGIDAVHAANESLNTDSDRITMLGLLLPELATDDASLALATITSMYAADWQIALRSIALWAEVEPLSALELASSVRSEIARHKLSRAVIAAWTESNPLDLLESLGQIPDYLSQWFQSEAIYVLANTSFETATRYVAEMPDETRRDNMTYILVTNWAEQDPRAALDWVLQDWEVQIDPQFRAQAVINGIVRSDRVMALNMALELPADEKGVGYESMVIGTIAESNPQLAIDLLDKTRNKETKELATNNVGRQLLRQGDIERFIDLVKNWSPDMQFKYYRSMAMSIRRSNMHALYDNLDEIPIREIQKFYSKHLLMYHTHDPAFDEKQVTKLEELAQEQ